MDDRDSTESGAKRRLMLENGDDGNPKNNFLGLDRPEDMITNDDSP
jgi:hypothetical protein